MKHIKFFAVGVLGAACAAVTGAIVISVPAAAIYSFYVYPKVTLTILGVGFTYLLGRNMSGADWL